MENPHLLRRFIRHALIGAICGGVLFVGLTLLISIGPHSDWLLALFVNWLGLMILYLLGYPNDKLGSPIVVAFCLLVNGAIGSVIFGMLGFFASLIGISWKAFKERRIPPKR